MHNKLCEKCSHNCKQAETVTVLECRHFRPKPVQMEFRFKPAGGSGKKSLKHAVDESS